LHFAGGTSRRDPPAFQARVAMAAASSFSEMVDVALDRDP
jgi:hypothetical protein